MKPQFIDTHSHVNFPVYDTDRNEVFTRAKERSVWMINVGTQKDTSKRAVELVREGVYAIVGLHPLNVNTTFHDVDELGESVKKEVPGEDFDYNYYKKLCDNKQVVGIGECGLDFYRKEFTKEEKDRQVEAFKKQIELALELDKPLMLHIRNAYDEAIEVLDLYKTEYYKKLRGNAHFFAGTKEQAQKFIERGFTISFTGVITFAKEYAEVIRSVPLTSILSETDCPYVSPVPYRGKRNEPLYVEEVVKKLAEIRGEDLETLRAQMIKNAFRVFGL